MSNHECPHCGMTNIDCGWGKFKTPREIELEARVKELKKYIQEREVWGDHCEFCKHNDKENCHLNIILDNLKTINRYRKALEEIEKIIVSEDVEIRPKLYDFEQDNKILNIINKAKGDN